MILIVIIVLIINVAMAVAVAPSDVIWEFLEAMSAGGNCKTAYGLLAGNLYSNSDGPGTQTTLNRTNIIQICAEGNMPGVMTTRSFRYKTFDSDLSRWGNVDAAILQGYRTKTGVCGFVFADSFFGQVSQDGGAIHELFELYDADAYAGKLARCQGTASSQRTTASPPSADRSTSDLCRTLLATYGSQQCDRLVDLVTPDFEMHDMAFGTKFTLNQTIAQCKNPLYSEDYVFFDGIETSPTTGAIPVTYAFTALDPKTNSPCGGLAPIHYMCERRSTSDARIAKLAFVYTPSSLGDAMTRCHQTSTSILRE